jgi:hypothetical protein
MKMKRRKCLLEKLVGIICTSWSDKHEQSVDEAAREENVLELELLLVVVKSQ